MPQAPPKLGDAARAMAIADGGRIRLGRVEPPAAPQLLALGFTRHGCVPFAATSCRHDLSIGPGDDDQRGIERIQRREVDRVARCGAAVQDRQPARDGQPDGQSRGGRVAYAARLTSGCLGDRGSHRLALGWAMGPDNKDRAFLALPRQRWCLCRGSDDRLAGQDDGRLGQSDTPGATR